MSQTADDQASEGPRALVVDDDEVLLLICGRVLTSQGYRVESARDGASALRALRRTSFDVLVSDIQMPGMSGMELLEQMRADGVDIPTVLVTGDPNLQSAMEAIGQGVLRYLAKPVEPRALVAVVNDVVRLHGLARAQRLALDNEALQSLVEELRRSRDGALAGTRAKTAFLSKMGHELRGPMSSVIGMTELALRTELTSVGRDCLEAVKTSADALMETISHVLDLADLESGGLELDLKPFSARDVIEGTLNELRGPADARGLALTTHFAAAFPDAMVGDAARFGLVIRTLLGNAIKFTKKGVITIRAELAEPRAGELRVRVSIADTGVGIPAEALSRVVDAFSQGDDSPTRGYGGAGLGLTIASQLAALMKGSLAIESTVNVGTTLVLTVSLEPVMADDGFLMVNSHPGRRQG